MICFDDPKYWLELARNERAAANEDRARRGGKVESIRIHEQNAVEYEQRAAALTVKNELARGAAPALATSQTIRELTGES